MNGIKKHFLKNDAKRHAELGVDVEQDLVRASLGNRPVLDPTGNLIHAGYVARMNNLGELGDHREEEDALERRAIEHPSTFALTSLLFFLFLAECLGGVLLMRALGYEGLERLVLGAMLAAFIYFCTWLAARSATEETATPRQRLWYFGALAVYAIVLISVAGVRVSEAITAGGSPLEDLFTGVILLVSSVGPAAISEVVMRRRDPAVRIQKELALVRRRLKAAQKEHDRAVKNVEGVVRATSAYDNEATLQASIYSIEHKVTLARRGSGMGGQGSSPVEMP